MLPLYSNAVAKRQFTVVYRGYDFDLTDARALRMVCRSSPENSPSAHYWTQRSLCGRPGSSSG